MRITDIIYKKLCGTITEEEQWKLDEWTAASGSHLKMYEDILGNDDIAQTYANYKKIDVDHAWTSFNNSHKPSRSKAFTTWLKPIVGIAAVALIVFGLWLWYSKPTFKPQPPVAVSTAVHNAIEKSRRTGHSEADITFGNSSMTVSRNVSDSILTAFANGEAVDCKISTRQEKEFWMTLPDGTRVHLDGGTTISYTSTFGSNTRTVYLHGTAFFFVAKNADLPFIVKTDNGDVKEYGTEFNVEATPRRTSVVLVSGSIGIIPKEGKETMLKPGCKGEVVNGGAVSVSKCDVSPYIAWNEGLYSFEDITLKKLMDVLAHWYGVNVDFADHALENKTITGVLSRYDDINSSLRALSIVAQVDMSVHGNTIIIR